MTDRRAFLRGIVSLPLIGGSVALIGNPTATAIPTSRLMLHDYADFLGLERWRTLALLYGDENARLAERCLPCHGPAWAWHQTSGSPVARVPVVLSAVGVPLAAMGRETVW